jgi:hypothetical protein
MYALLHYDNPHCKDIQEFFEDVKRLHYIRRLFRRYKDDNILKERLIINHLVTFYNVFENKAATRILFHRIEKNFHSMLKTFLIFLNRMPTDQHADIPLELLPHLLQTGKNNRPMSMVLLMRKVKY